MVTLRELAYMMARACPEELKKACPDRSVDEWVEGVFIPRLTDYFCYAANREHYEPLLEKARAGDDESLFKLVRVFKNLKHEQPFVMARCRRAEQEKDFAFEKKYAEAIQAPMRHENTNITLLFHLILYREFIEARTAREGRKFFTEVLGLTLKEDEKTFARYCQRLGFRTGAGKRGKRKGDPGIPKPAMSFKNIARSEGISPERARQIYRTALTKLEAHKKKFS